MQTRIVTRPAVAAMALVIAWTAAPRAGNAQQCRRTCETGETRDVRGCCVPAAKPAPKPARPEARPERTPRRERPPREEPKAEAPAAKPSAPPAARPNEPPASKPNEPRAARPSEPSASRPTPPHASKPGESPAVKPNRQPAAPAPSEPSASKSSEPTRDTASKEATGSRTVTVPGAASGTPPTIQKTPRSGDAPTIQAHGSTQTETSAPSRDEPGDRQVQDFDESFDKLLAEAQTAARAGLYDKAKRLCSQAFEQQPGDARAVIVCAIAACNAGDRRWAMHYYAMASAGQKHTIYNICSAKGIEVRGSAPPANMADGAPLSKTDEPPGLRGKAPPLAETSDATQPRRAGQPPGATASGNLRTESPTTARTEAIVPSRSDADRPTDTRPGLLEPPQLTLVPTAPVAEHEPRRRWPVWMPWAVVGAGAVVAGVGEVLYNVAYSEYDEFDKSFSERCQNGCRDSEIPDLVNQLDRARTLETTSRISMVVGGVTVAAGVALVFLNQATKPTSERATARTFLVPTLSPGTAGISAGISF